MRALTAAILLVLAMSAVAAQSALAQGLDGGLAQDSVEGEVQVRVVGLGPGGASRPGTWTGAQVQLNDLGLEQRDVVLRVEGADPDGDRPLFDRVVTTNPGTAQTFWVYFRLPQAFERGQTVTVRAYEAIDGGASAGQLGFRAGRILGSDAYPVNRVVSAEDSAVGVMGDWTYGLQGYGPAASRRQYPAVAHDVIVPINGLRVAGLPDRWQGLAVLDTLVWGRGVGPTDPGALTPEQAGAIEDWVARGGHLIVVLPSSGQEWVSQQSNRLRRMLPVMEAPVRHEGVDLEDYRELLTKRPEAVMPGSGVVHELIAADDAAQGQAVSIIRDRAGRCVVMRRSVGTGAVTVVGLDLSSAAMRVIGPGADSFWHRVLGRRGQAFTAEQAGENQFGNLIEGRDEVAFDDDIGGAIAMTGSAAAGVLLGLILFAAYWLIAGPVGFLLLKNAKRKHLAWPVFIATTLVFTVIAWTGAAALRPKSVRGTHVSYFEQVHGQPTQRARTWVSLLIPRYGEARVSVEDERSPGPNLVSAWRPVLADIGALQSFPDNRGYRIEARSPEGAPVPTRQTVKQLTIDWAGEGRWSMIRPLIDPADPREVEFAYVESGAAYVTGQLVHDLPGALEDVVVFMVERPQRIADVGLLDQSPSVAFAFSAEGAYEPWDPGEVLDLELMTGPGEDGRLQRGREYTAARYFEILRSEGRPRSPGVARSTGDLEGRLTAVRLFSQLTPANLRMQDSKDHVIGRRVQSHGWDLGRWFTQPCVIVIGHMVVDASDASAAASPVPLTVDGRDVPMAGRTVVSWVYPLGDADTTWARRVGDASEDESEDGADGSDESETGGEG